MLYIKKVLVLCLFSLSLVVVSCGGNEEAQNSNVEEVATPTTGQSNVQDTDSKPNVVQIAVGSKDHTTLVKAVQAADLVNSLSNAGPFTVFAPTNAAFDALPAGTVEGLLKKDKIADLSNILEYHVYVGVIRESMLSDGMVLNEVNGKDVTIKVTPEGNYVNDAKILGAVEGSNGIVYVIDKVLLPK